LELREYNRIGIGRSTTAMFHIYLDDKRVEDIHVTANKKEAILHVSKDHTITLQEMELLTFEMRRQKDKVQYSY
jgi:ABC-type iron transport system FetAB ATPase subunit